MNPTALLIVILIFAAVWILIIRPQRRRNMQQAEMLALLEVGDEIVTAGGIYGTIRELDEDEALVEIAPAITVRLARRAVAGVITPEAGEETPEDPAGEAEAPLTDSERAS